MVIDKFFELALLWKSAGSNKQDHELVKAADEFVDNSLTALSISKDPDIAYSLCATRILLDLSKEKLDWEKLNLIFEDFLKSRHGPLNWLSYRFYTYRNEHDLDNPNSFFDLDKGWNLLNKAVDASDPYAMFEKASLLNRMGASAGQRKEALSLIDHAIKKRSKAALYLKSRWHLEKGSFLPYSEKKARDFLLKAKITAFDKYLREDWLDEEIEYELAKLHLTSSELGKDLDAGEERMRNAAKKGHIHASIWVEEFDRKNRPNPMVFFRSDAINAKQPDKFQDANFDTAMNELNDLVGLEKIKATVESLVQQERAMALRRKKGLKVPNRSYHMVFSGNPGTGKTETAKRMARIFKNLGILKTDNIHVVTRENLIGEYVGQTQPKTLEAIKKAQDGVLFIDEAYSLAQEYERDFGHEAIQTLLYEMEERRTEFIVIVAGYKEQMGAFLRSNPGLASRFNYHFEFNDYSEKDLTKIFQSFCLKNEYDIGTGVDDMVSSYFKNVLNKKAHRFAYARDVRSFFEKAVEKQSRRIIKDKLKSKKALKELKAIDLPLDANITMGNVHFLKNSKKSD